MKLEMPDAAMRKDLHEENRLSWNAATVAHNSQKRDQARFLRDEESRLHPEDRHLLGDLRGKSVVHLQCNSGQDTFAIQKLGAKSVLGIDISDEAVAFARQLSSDSGIPAEFVRSDVYDWLEAAGRDSKRWDIVYCSYGAICWLSDLRAWARGIAGILAPGGRFVTIEYHTGGMIFNERLQHHYAYSTHGAPCTADDGVHDYVAVAGEIMTPSGWDEGVKEFRNPHRVHEFIWSPSEVISALLDAGLSLADFREYDYSTGFNMFQNMRRLEGGRWGMPVGVPALPLMYSVVASHHADTERVRRDLRG
jgi:SAM-dependent methyltransferase